jgi:peptide/nickel transport system substrate-binding protein
VTMVRGALGFTIGTLNPFRASGAGAVAVLDHVHDPLMRRDPSTGVLRPGLLASKPEHRGGGHYVLDLASDARFHSGRAVNADDVVASIRAFAAQDQKANLLSGSLGFIREARPSSDRRILLWTEGEPSCLADRLALVRVVPEERIHDALTGAEMYDGTGPFRITEVEGDTRVLLESVSDHRVSSSSLELRAVVDAEAREEGLLDGSFHAIEEPRTALLPRIAELDFFRLEQLRSRNMSWLMFNCADKRMRDIHIRRAVAKAVDTSAISRRLLPFRFTPASSLLPAWHPDFAASADYPVYDPAGARALLRQAGFPQGFDIELLVSSVSWVVDQAELVVADLARVGITAIVRIAHTADLFTEEIPDGRYQLLLASGDPSPYGVDGEFLLRWYFAGTWARVYSHWDDESVRSVEALLDRAQTSDSDTIRTAALDAIQQIVACQVPVFVLGHRDQPTAWSTQLEGFHPSMTTGLSLRDAHVVRDVL